MEESREERRLESQRRWRDNHAELANFRAFNCQQRKIGKEPVRYEDYLEMRHRKFLKWKEREERLVGSRQN